MLKLWNRLSTLGLSKKSESLEYRTYILSNQINLVMLLLLSLLYLVASVDRWLEQGNPTIGTTRILILIGFNILNIALAFKKHHQLQKIILIFIPTFVTIIFPSLIGFIEQESFFYYPYVIVAFSIVPQLVLIARKNRILFGISEAYFLILILFCDNIILLNTDKYFEVNDIINSFYIIYKTIPVAIYFFFNFSIYYLRNLNQKFENEILTYNQELNSTLKKLKITQQHLVQSEKMASLGILTTGIAHEINNPLNFIRGGIEIINNLKKNLIKDDEELNKQCNTAIKIINEGVDRASKIISSLMTFSYRGKPELIKSDLAEISERTLLFLKAKITNKIQINKEYKIDEEIPVYQDKMHQILLNIIDNAIYAVNLNITHKVINISIQEEITKIKKYAVISISNNGPKIPDKDIKHIFDPFYTTKDPGKGTGLGLSICYTLVKEHNGIIYAENKDDKVIFTIKIPSK